MKVFYTRCKRGGWSSKTTETPSCNRFQVFQVILNTFGKNNNFQACTYKLLWNGHQLWPLRDEAFQNNTLWTDLRSGQWHSQSTTDVPCSHCNPQHNLGCKNLCCVTLCSAVFDLNTEINRIQLWGINHFDTIVLNNNFIFI